MKRHIVAVAIIAITGFLAACGGDNSPAATVAPTTTTTTTTTTAAVCAARDALTSSIADLKNVDIVKNGVSALQTALSAVTDNLKAVASSASQELQPEVKALQDSLAQLATAITDVGSSGVSGVTQAAQAAVSSAGTLTKDLNNLNCG